MNHIIRYGGENITYTNKTEICGSCESTVTTLNLSEAPREVFCRLCTPWVSCSMQLPSTIAKVDIFYQDLLIQSYKRVTGIKIPRNDHDWHELLTKIFELSDKGFEFRLDFIVYSLLAVMYQSGDEMKKLHSPENKEKISKVEIVSANFACDKHCRLPTEARFSIIGSLINRRTLVKMLMEISKKHGLSVDINSLEF